MKKYSVGIDFGTLSGRAVLVRHADGAELASAVMDYPHGVMDRCLWDGTPLPPDFALQHPQDYLDVLADVIPRVLAQAGVSAEEIAGICVDFTSCTVIPALADGTPGASDIESWYALQKSGIDQKLEAIAAEKDHPCVYVTTLDGQAILSRDQYVPAMIDVFNCEEEFRLTAPGGIRVRGNSTAEQVGAWASWST